MKKHHISSLALLASTAIVAPKMALAQTVVNSAVQQNYISGSTNIVNGGSISSFGGVLSIGGTSSSPTVVNVTAGGSISGPQSIVVGTNSTLNNNGGSISSTGVSSVYGSSPGLTVDGTVIDSGADSSFNVPEVEVDQGGTFTVTNGADISTIETENSGTVNIESGSTLSVTEPADMTGVYNVDSSSTLNFLAPVSDMASNSFPVIGGIIASSGTLNLAGQICANNAGDNITGTVNLLGASTISSGQIDGTINVETNASYANTSANIGANVETSTINVLANSALELSGASAFQGTANISNGGTLAFTNSSVGGTINLNSANLVFEGTGGQVDNVTSNLVLGGTNNQITGDVVTNLNNGINLGNGNNTISVDNISGDVVEGTGKSTITLSTSVLANGYIQQIPGTLTELSIASGGEVDLNGNIDGTVTNNGTLSLIGAESGSITNNGILNLGNSTEVPQVIAGNINGSGTTSIASSDTLSGEISGSQSVVVAGESNTGLPSNGVQLTNTQNSYTGGTTVSGGGTLTVLENGELGSGAVSLVNSNLQMGNGVNLSNNIDLQESPSDGGQIVVEPGSTVYSETLSGNISGGTSQSPVVLGIESRGFLPNNGEEVSPTLTLSGENSFSGGLSIAGVNLSISNADNLGNASNAMLFEAMSAPAADGSQHINSSLSITQNMTISNPIYMVGAFTPTVFNELFASNSAIEQSLLNGLGQNFIQTNGNTLELDGGLYETPLIEGGGTVIINSDDTQNMSRLVALEQSMGLETAYGQLSSGLVGVGIESGTTLATGKNANISQAYIEFDSPSATFDISNGPSQVEVSGLIGSGGNINLGNNMLVDNAAPLSTTLDSSLYKQAVIGYGGNLVYNYGGDISGTGGVTVEGNQTLTGDNTYTGGTTVDGTLSINGDSNLGGSTGNLILNGGTLNMLDALNSQRMVILMGQNNVLDTNGYNAVLSGNIISGLASSVLEKTGAGNLTLSGLNDDINGLVINQGSVVIGSGGNTNNMSVSFTGSDSSSSLDLSQTNGPQVVNGLHGVAGTINLGSDNLVVDGDGAFGGGIEGTGGLVVNGGHQVLFGTSTYTGGTTIDGGELEIAGSYSPSINGPLTFNINPDASQAGELKVDGNINLASSTINLNAASGRYVPGSLYNLISAASITGTGTLNLEGAYAQYLTAVASTISSSNNDVYEVELTPTAGSPADGNQNGGSGGSGGSSGTGNSSGNTTGSGGNTGGGGSSSSGSGTGTGTSTGSGTGTSTGTGTGGGSSSSGSGAGSNTGSGTSNGGGSSTGSGTTPTPTPNYANSPAFRSGMYVLANTYAQNQALMDVLGSANNSSYATTNDGYWMHGLGAYGHMPGATYNYKGYVIGKGFDITPHVTAGIAISNVFVNSSAKAEDANVDETTIGGLGYVKYQNGRLGLNGDVTVGHLDNTNNRSIPGIGTGKFKSSGVYEGVDVGASYNVYDGEHLFVTPRTSLSVLHTHLGSGSETGLNILNLNYDAINSTTVQSNDGVDFGWKENTNYGQLTTYAGVGGAFALGQRNAAVEEHLGSFSARESSQIAPSETFTPSLGVKLTSARWSVGASWNGAFASGLGQQAFMLNGSMKF